MDPEYEIVYPVLKDCGLIFRRSYNTHSDDKKQHIQNQFILKINMKKLKGLYLLRNLKKNYTNFNIKNFV